MIPTYCYRITSTPEQEVLGKILIMARSLSYPDNWTEIATAIKESAGYRCHRCHCQCLPPTNSYRHLDLSLRRSLSAQVHHIDGNPDRNHPANLICLCAGCHLRVHRHHPLPIPGQLSLDLKLPTIRRSRKSQRKQRIQIAFVDLISRLPRLPLDEIEQLELDLQVK
jgi:hypothetical protein